MAGGDRNALMELAKLQAAKWGERSTEQIRAFLLATITGVAVHADRIEIRINRTPAAH